MVSEARKQSMARMETDYSKHTYFRWKVKCRLEHLGALGIMGDGPLNNRTFFTREDKGGKILEQKRILMYTVPMSVCYKSIVS